MVRSESPPLVVCDAGRLIHLDELGCVDLLADFAEVCVPDAVWEEVQRHRPSALRRRSVRFNRVDLIPEAREELAFLIRALQLDAGEVEALRIMHQFPEGIFLTDDLAARLAATQLGFRVHGTIGVVVRAVRRRQRTKRQVVNLLRAIPRRTTLHITADLLGSVIEQVLAS